MKKKTVAVVPAFNEETTIGVVVKKLSKYVDKIIVVSDGSNDNTIKIAKKNKAIVLKNSCNKGPDKAIEKGIIKAKKLKYKFIVTFDADGQHPYEKIPLFINKLYANKADIVVASRKEFPRFSEYIFSLYSNFKIKVHDPINGFKAFKIELIKEIGYFDNINGLTSQILFNAKKRGFKICSIPIKVKKRNDDPRIGGLLMSNYKILRSLIRIFLNDIIKT